MTITSYVYDRQTGRALAPAAVATHDAWQRDAEENALAIGEHVQSAHHSRDRVAVRLLSSALGRQLLFQNHDTRFDACKRGSAKPAVCVRARGIHWTDGGPVMTTAGQAPPPYGLDAMRRTAIEANREFWKRIEDSLSGGPPAYEVPQGALAARMEALVQEEIRSRGTAPWLRQQDGALFRWDGNAWVSPGGLERVQPY